MLTIIIILALTIALGVPAALLVGISLGVSLSNRSWLMQLHETISRKITKI